MSSVKLAIRVRPFSEREIKSESDRVRVVNVIDDHYVSITNIKVSLSGAGDSRERVRRYHADYTFDSACSSNQPTYATQERLFETIGREVLTSITQGFSTCVMAYGQSATGKTHTMMGSESQPGLIPRICKALAEEQPCDITISFLEIYNERVHDLLVGETPSPTCHSLPRRRGNARKDLWVREHPAKGPYVQNLRRVAVNNVEALLALVAEGTRRRRTAATRRNTESSRSHALLEIAIPRATLHLADLAGSEKAGWEGCGGRQKEGANINKSLVALSNVISALVSGAGGRGKFVPYRDSALTWLLKDSFTGGATTFIIATVSPSFACYGESASTLRWAARARQLRTPKNTCEASVTPRAVLQAQYDQLIIELGRNFIRYIPETGYLSFDDKHWELFHNKSKSKNVVASMSTNIGNNMSQPRDKVEANSESTASSAATCGGSNVVDVIDNIKITNAINEEVDKFFGPALERTSSGSNLKIVAPLRYKRRQYKSQEVLPPHDKLSTSQSQSSLASPSESETQLNVTRLEKRNIPHVAILHENQRAEIVASVTERLYSKLKKKEEAAVSKIESVVDRKIMEPLSELRICTNARQRLMELSQKAIRNKRKIGIPAYTQTKTSVLRIKDQGTDIQTDLGSYIMENRCIYSLHRDVGTETIPMTPRCKEVSVGSKYDLVNFTEISTGTQTRLVPYKTCFVMTDNPTTYNQSTQTQVIPPPRRKKRAPLYPNNVEYNRENFSPESISAPVISINISKTYSIDSGSHSSDDNFEINFNSINPGNVTSTPDLLTNHSTSDAKVEDENNEQIDTSYNDLEKKENIKETINKIENVSVDFSDQEEYDLPRVRVDTSVPTNNFEMRNMILGRNKNMYPYNIVLSPLKEKENVKRIVKFKDFDIDNEMNDSSESSWDWDDGLPSNKPDSILMPDINKEPKYIETLGSIYSDSSDSSKVEMDSFAWKKERYARTMDCKGKKRVHVYKSNPRYNTTNNKYYRDNMVTREQKCDSSYEIHHNDVIHKDCSENVEVKAQSFNKPSQNINNINVHDSDTDFDVFDKKMNVSCNDLDESTKRYDKYLQNYQSKMKNVNNINGYDKKPKEFLQELVQLRREIIKSSGNNTDSSVSVVNRDDRN